MDDPEPVIPGYERYVLLGVGMTATVWRAHQSEFDRDVAVKVLKPGFERGDARERFEREKKISAKLGDHPFVVAVYATGTTTDGRPYMAMSLCEQGSLADVLASRGSFDVDDVIDIGIKVASAVEAAHEKGILHRDIKPENILLTEYGPALSDFGISRATTSEMTATVQHLTPVHSAPEAFLDTPPTPQMDVYSLGSTLFTLLAGRPAYPRRPNETYTQYILRLERDPLPAFRRRDVPEPLRHIIATAMATQPADRFPHARDLEHALRALHHQRDATHGDAPTRSDITTQPNFLPSTTSPLPHDTNLTVIRTPPPDPQEARTVIRPRTTPTRHRTRTALIVTAATLTTLALLITAITLANPGQTREQPTAITPKVIEPALAPNDLEVIRNGPRADLTWTAAGDSQSYLVAWRPDGARAKSSTRVEPSETTRFSIVDLEEGTSYCYQVIAVISLRTQSSPAGVCDTP